MGPGSSKRLGPRPRSCSCTLAKSLALLVGLEVRRPDRLAAFHPMVVLSGRQAVLPARLDDLEPGAEPRFVRGPERIDIDADAVADPARPAGARIPARR